MRMSSMRGSAGAGSSINVTIVRSCWRSSGSGGKYPGTRTDLTNSPTICALGSMTRLPRRMRWPSRMRSASSSLSAVCDSSSLGGVAWSVMTFLRRALYCSSPLTTARAGSRMGAMTSTAKRNLIAQWAFDTRPVLLRFHLWLEDVEVERAQAEPVDRRVRRLLNETGHTFEQFHEWLKSRGITLWGAAVDTLENTSRFADGQPTGPMAVFHLFDSPLRLSRPYESYMGCLTVPARVAEAAENASVLLDYRTPRRQVAETIEAAYPGIRRAHIHVWTLRGKSRVRRL